MKVESVKTFLVDPGSHKHWLFVKVETDDGRHGWGECMAEPYHIAVAPHNYNSTTVGLAATLHAAAGMPNFLITEYFVNFEETGAAIARAPLRVEQGQIALPTAPGLGIDLDEAALARHPFRAPALRSLRRPEDE